MDNKEIKNRWEEVREKISSSSLLTKEYYSQIECREALNENFQYDAHKQRP